MAANKADLEAAKAQGLDSALIDRLTLTSKGVANMVGARNLIRLCFDYENEIDADQANYIINKIKDEIIKIQEDIDVLCKV